MPKHLAKELVPRGAGTTEVARPIENDQALAKEFEALLNLTEASAGLRTLLAAQHQRKKEILGCSISCFVYFLGEKDEILVTLYRDRPPSLVACTPNGTFLGKKSGALIGPMAEGIRWTTASGVWEWPLSRPLG